MSNPEIQLLEQIRQSGLPEPVREFRFCDRRWRFDFAWVELRIAVEVQGGQYLRGRHNRPEGYRNDCEKIDQALLMDWDVYLVTPDMINDESALGIVKKALGFD